MSLQVELSGGVEAGFISVIVHPHAEDLIFSDLVLQMNVESRAFTITEAKTSKEGSASTDYEQVHALTKAQAEDGSLVSGVDRVNEAVISHKAEV